MVIENFKLGEVIASRRLFVADEKARTLEVTVKLGKPKSFPGSSDYYCPYQITGLGNERVRYAGGVDAVQAVQLAMQMIGADLYLVLNPTVGNRLRWEGNEHGDLGFPAPPRR